jgi:histone H3
MDSTQVGIFEKTNKVGFRGFLKGGNGSGLETKIGLEVLSDFSDQTLEGQLSDQQFGRLLVTSNFTKCHSTGSESVGLLDTSSSLDAGLSSGLLGCGVGLARSFTSSGFAGSLLCTSHVCFL